MDAFLNSAWFQANGWLLPTALVALAAGWFGYQFLSVLTYPRNLLGSTHPFEVQRRTELRAGNVVYRWLEPLVDELGAFFKRKDSESLKSLGVNLVAGREKLPWKPEEFLAVKWFEAVLLGAGLFFVLWFGGFSTLAVIVGVGVAALYGFMTPRSARNKSHKRLARIRIRLPFAVDLIALTMEAGGGFQECLATAVNENGDHPLTDELAEVLRQISLGRPRNEALSAMQERLHDEDINELVFAINKGEELGTPLSAILRDQAEQMRLKRSQRGEKAAGEAEVNILFPGMVLMIACLLVVITPIVLPAVLALF